MAYPILDPPEENRSYSSDDEHGPTYHNKSRIGSHSAWTGGSPNQNPWMTIDAGEVISSIGGVVLTIRKDKWYYHIVTSVQVDHATDEGKWTKAFAAPIATNLTIHDSETLVRLHFDKPIPARYVRIHAVSWKNAIGLRAGLILSGPALDDHLLSGGVDQLRNINDADQLPAIVALRFLPGGNPPPVDVPRPFGVLVLPSLEGGWEGRKWTWTIKEFNGQPTCDNVFAVSPGQRCAISVHVSTRWQWNTQDVASNCIIQLYYAIKDVFHTGVVKRGIHNHENDSTTEFVAPKTQGLYYIVAEMTLDYDYKDYVMGFLINSPYNAFAAIRVLPTEFSQEVFRLLSEFAKQQIIAILAFRNRKGDEATVFSRLPIQHAFAIFSFFMGTGSGSDLN